jgi:hypothetical protein
VIPKIPQTSVRIAIPVKSSGSEGKLHDSLREPTFLNGLTLDIQETSKARSADHGNGAGEARETVLQRL